MSMTSKLHGCQVANPSVQAKHLIDLFKSLFGKYNEFYTHTQKKYIIHMCIPLRQKFLQITPLNNTCSCIVYR